MSKNIVFCADGTWNHPNDPRVEDANANPSNVYKLFLKLDGTDEPGTIRLADEQEKTLRQDGGILQVAKYLHGVGDSKNRLVQLLGGGFGEGLITRIVRGYTFVSRTYEPGDRIYLIGFSRGAYTARALAGLISKKGLLPPAIAAEHNKDEAYRQGSAVWYEWRRQTLRGDDGLTGHLHEFARNLPHFLFEPPDHADLIPAPIEAVAVWDTVGAYGIPQFDGHGDVVDSFRFADTKLSDNVNFGRHAVSIDEQRKNFTPTLWDGDQGRVQQRNRILQVLFAGGHADVGGSNLLHESGLSDCALRWMTRELKALGLKIGPPVIPETPDPCSAIHAEWLKPWWQLIGAEERTIPPSPDLCLSESVLLRLAAEAQYDPKNIATYRKEKLAAQGVEVIPLDDPPE